MQRSLGTGLFRIIDHTREIRFADGLLKSTTLVLPPAFEDAHRIPDAERP
jgi:hypothetical protein